MKDASSIPTKRLGRNDPCFCGSGKKYKKCCLDKYAGFRPIYGTPPDINQSEVLEKIQKAEAEARLRAMALQDKGIFIHLPNTIGFKGMRLLAVGNRIASSTNEKATFHELIVLNLQHTLGREWWDQETSKPEHEQHFIRRCFSEFERFTKDAADKRQEPDGNWSAEPNGYAQSLLSLAFDV